MLISIVNEKSDDTIFISKQIFNSRFHMYVFLCYLSLRVLIRA